MTIDRLTHVSDCQTASLSYSPIASRSDKPDGMSQAGDGRPGAPHHGLHDSINFADSRVRPMKVGRRVVVALACAILTAACKRAPVPARAVTADAAFCKQVQTTDAKLSEHLAPLASRMRTGTGVYPLEEGDVSMIARA